VRAVVTGRVVRRYDLDLLAEHRGGHGHHECADVAADVEQDRALPGVRVLVLVRVTVLRAHAFVFPGLVW
jgi:hypothetical protein